MAMSTLGECVAAIRLVEVPCQTVAPRSGRYKGDNRPLSKPSYNQLAKQQISCSR